MDILAQLGINFTAVIQFVLFSIVMIFLSKFVFAPYAHVLEERETRTKGGEDLALEFHNKATELQSEYETKLVSLNKDMKEIIDASKAEASKNMEAAVTEARKTADQLIADNKVNIANSVKKAESELKNETNSAALLITNKLLGK